MKYIFAITLAFGFSSCLKLDGNLYNRDNTITEYKLDNFTDTQDFILDSSYNIASNKITLMSLQSKATNESQATAIKAIYIGDVSRIAKDTIILYCHGNKWHMDFYWQRAKLLAHINGKHRYGVLYFDYRGYGLSEGSPTEEGMYADADACLQWLKEQGLSSDRLMIYGFSLGSASATELSATPRSLRPSKLILEAPFASSEVMVQDASQLNMPASYFTEVKIANAEKIKKCATAFILVARFK
jgi:pimeloyl-ACP methyl ester carboxylesterase